MHKEDLIKKLLSEGNKSGLSNPNLSNTNLSYQQVLQLTNKSIPPIMKNLFNEQSSAEQNYYGSQMSYQNIPYGYYAPPMQYPMPYQIPYPMPYPMQMPMQPMQQYEAPVKEPEVEETKTSASTVKQKEKVAPETTFQKEAPKQQVTNTTYMTNMSQQIPMQQYPMYQPQFPYAMPPAPPGPPMYYPYYPPQMPYQYGNQYAGGQYAGGQYAGGQYGGQYGGYMPYQYTNPANFNQNNENYN